MLEKIYSVEDAEFRTYGRIIRDLDITEIVEAANQIKNPAEGSSYLPSREEFEKLKIFHEIEDKFYDDRIEGWNKYLKAIEKIYVASIS